MDKGVRVADACSIDSNTINGKAASASNEKTNVAGFGAAVHATTNKSASNVSSFQNSPDQKTCNCETKSTSSEVLTSFTEIDRLWRAFDEVYRNAATRMGLSEAAFEVLYALRQLGEGCLQKDICQNACLGKQTVNSSVHKLVKDGILRLEPADFGRGTKIFLTQKGKEVVAKKVDPIIQADIEAFGSLTKEERRAAVEIETKYLQALRFKVAEATK